MATARGTKAARERLRRELRAAGSSVPQIASQMRDRLGVRPRTAWRYALGWTQETLVLRFRWVNADIPITISRVSEWENWPYGSGGQMSLEILGALALTFANGCRAHDLVDDVDLSHISPAGRQWIDRRAPTSATARVLAPPPAVAAAPSPARSADTHATAMESFRISDRQVGGGHLYSAVVAYLNTSLARDLVTVDSVVATSPFTAAAALSEMAGWMAHDGGSDALAEQHFARAIHLAAVDGDAQVTAHVLGSAAHLALLRSDPDRAEALTAQGLHAARDPAIPGILRARLLGMRARAAAAHGENRRRLDALATAESEVQRAGSVPLSKWVSRFDGASLAMDAARSLLIADDLTGAREQAEHVVAQRPADRARSRALGQLMLARTLLASRRPDEAAALSLEVLTATAHLGSGVVVSQLRDLARTLDQAEHGRAVLDVARQIAHETQWRATSLEGAAS